VFGDILKNGAVIDEGIFLKFYAARSYTGEDTLAISCHGGIYITNLVLSAAIEAGARLAQPGEFTKRAYINGKISLTGAEAVGRLISAASEIGAKVASAQTRGGLSGKIKSISDGIKKMISEIYVYIDYPGEDLQDVTPEDMLASLERVRADLENLSGSYNNAGKIITDGINCAIIGKPNTGKSTLLNLLARDEVAIVHEMPGTTRDIISARVNLGRFTLNLYDTAGIRETDGEIENIGIDKARAKIEECNLIIGVFAADNLNQDDEVILQILREQNAKKVLLLVNKCDICDICNENNPDKFFSEDYILISAKENISGKPDVSALQSIEKKLEEMYNLDSYNLDSGEILTEERQYFEICEALANIKSAINTIESGFTLDIAGLDLELAVQNLDRCDSKAVSEDIVTRIFKNFCVGK
jgi:tRNA modification GTPase